MYRRPCYLSTHPGLCACACVYLFKSGYVCLVHALYSWPLITQSILIQSASFSHDCHTLAAAMVTCRRRRTSAGVREGYVVLSLITVTFTHTRKDFNFTYSVLNFPAEFMCVWLHTNTNPDFLQGSLFERHDNVWQKKKSHCYQVQWKRLQTMLGNHTYIEQLKYATGKSRFLTFLCLESIKRMD